MIRHSLVRRTAAVLLSALVVQAGAVPYFSLSAWADDAPRVTILPLSGMEGVPAKAPERFRELLRSELESRDTLTFVDLPKGKATAEARPSSTPSADAVEALERGQAELAELKFDAAYGSLKKGIDLMTARPEAIDFDTLIEAYVSLAVASFRMGDEDAAQKALLSVVRLSPEYRLPDGKYPPIFVREHEKARRRAEKSVRGKITVDGPPGSNAFVDGKDLGMVPVVQENLAAGTHYVKVEGTRGQLYGQAVELKGGTSKVKAVFQGGGGGPSFVAAGPMLDDAALESVAAAASALSVDYAVVGVLYRSDDHQLTAATAVYSAEAKGFTAMKTYAFDEELLTANVEAFKLADDVSDAVGQFPRVASMPLNLAENATYRVSTASRTRTTEVEVSMVGPRRTALTPTDRPRVVEEGEGEGEGEGDGDGDGEVRRLDRGAVSGDGTGPVRGDDADGDGTVKSGGPAWWVWALVGVGVAAAAGGTYYGVTEATRPVTGTVTVKW